MSIVDDGIVPEAFKKAGFVDIRTRMFKLPTTPWPKDPKLQQQGAFSRLAMEQDLDGMDSKSLFLSPLPLSPVPPP
jgi:hypothetical protein